MPVVKGGVWTNIEDEILKASVSKYGLNQWARVSSLLARKTAKQCKARWTEWLDPSIKKIEWSREEDEKLLHLAKILSTQWRTIAPIVGRTANQCLDRYNKLLDEAEAKDAADLGLAGPEGGESLAASGRSTRRLRPGEHDPNPEAKPAKPDTIDLDEDEKEMLSEARARLANTQGKKAKRKARERQQEESRRLANLQKRRELKTAGINIKIVTRKPGQMDYNADIPFEMKPAPGFYDTSDELARNEYQRANFDPRKLQLASKRKGDGDEDADRKRRKNDKDAPSASLQAAMEAGKLQRMREAEQSSKRRALVLPAPQVSDGELDEIVKMGRMGEQANIRAKEGDNAATHSLVTSYSNLNTNAPIRTPMAPPQDDHIANEIHNIRATSETQSALLGGDNPELHEGKSTTGYEGMTPQKHVVSTPNPLATPLRSGGPMNGPGATPGATPLRPGQTPLRTPRDAFALNNEGGMLPPSATPRDARMAELSLRNKLMRGLASLPKPKQLDFELAVPEDREEVVASDDRAEDAGDRDRRERLAREAQEAAERRRQTQVIQREDMPRPPVTRLRAILAHADKVEAEEAALIFREAALLVAHDAIKFPLSASSKSVGKKAVSLDSFDDESLQQARNLIASEAGPSPSPDAVHKAFEARNPDSMLMGLSGYDDDEGDTAAIMTSVFTHVRESILSIAQTNIKIETKLERHLGGFMKRKTLLDKKIREAHKALQEATCALDGFKTLAGSEQVAIQRRLEGLRDEVGFVSRREREAQEVYRRTREELEALSLGSVNGIH